jgi:hypothetical protein
MAESQTASAKAIETPEIGISPDWEKNGTKDVATTNVSGHVQELDRQFGLLSICATGIVTGNTWTAVGGAIVSIFDEYQSSEPQYTNERIGRCNLQRWPAWCSL